MSTDLSGQNLLPHTVTITVGASWELITLPKGASRLDGHFVTNAGAFSTESGTPSSEPPIPADTWFPIWEAPFNPAKVDNTVQIKAAAASTTVHLRVV